MKYTSYCRMPRRIFLSALAVAYSCSLSFAQDPLVGYLILDAQPTSAGGTGFPALKRYDTDWNLIWESRQMIEFIDPGFGGPNDINLRSLNNITIGPDGYIYGGHAGTDNLGNRYNLATGALETRFAAAGNPDPMDPQNLQGSGIMGMTFGPDFNGNGTPDLYVTNRSGIEIHDVAGKSNAEIANSGGILDLGGGTTRIVWEDLFGADLPDIPGQNDRWSTAVTVGPDANGNGKEDLYFMISAFNGGNENDNNFIAVLSSEDLSVIKTVKSEWNRRGSGIAFDDQGNMFVSGQSRDTLNVHVDAIDHEADVGDPFFIAEDAARFVKSSGPLGNARPDNAESVHFGKDGKIYVGSRFGHRADTNLDEAGSTGAALIYEIDYSTPGEVNASSLTLRQGEDAGATGFHTDFEGSRILDFLPIFESDVSIPVANADFDQDGIVDGRDFLIWQRGFGMTDQTSNIFGDANGDGTVDGGDLTVWESQFGSNPPLTAVTTVPEPNTLIFMIWGIAFVASRRQVF